MTDDNERCCERWTIEVFMDEIIPIKPPDLLRILLNAFKCVTKSANKHDN